MVKKTCVRERRRDAKPIALVPPPNREMAATTIAHQILTTVSLRTADCEEIESENFTLADIEASANLSVANLFRRFEDRQQAFGQQLEEHLGHIKIRDDGLDLLFRVEVRQRANQGEDLVLVFSAGAHFKKEFRLTGWQRTNSQAWQEYAEKWLNYSQTQLAKDLLYYIGILFLNGEPPAGHTSDAL